MQRQRGTIGSLPGTFFDHGSTSSNAAIDKQSPNDMNIGYVNSVGVEEQEPCRWSLGEPSSNGIQHEVSHNERKTNNGWPSSMSTYAIVGPRLEEHQYEQNSLFVQSSNSYTVPQNLSLNASLAGLGDNNSHVTEKSNLYKPSGSENERSSHDLAPHMRFAVHPAKERLLKGMLASPLQVEVLVTSIEQKVVQGMEFLLPMQSSRSLPANHSLDLRTTTVVDTSGIQNPNVVFHVLTSQQNVQTFRWNRDSGSRTGSSLSFNVSGDRDGVPCEGHQSRSIARNLLGHRMFIPAPELRTSVRNPTNRGLNSGNISAPKNVASTSRVGSSSDANASSSSTMVPRHNPYSQFLQRLSELVRQSLMSPLGSEFGGYGNHSSLSSRRPTSPEEMLLSFGVANQGQHRPYPRSMAWLKRQDVGLLGIPHSLRTLAAATKGRTRLLVSEYDLAGSDSVSLEHIHNVLDPMRKGENLRFEDFMILDQPAFLGVAGIHDRHRDM
ncbi:hypothetical protein PTKIN_Ptkin09bG0139700 [Pterospermum kingtungense]